MSDPAAAPDDEPQPKPAADGSLLAALEGLIARDGREQTARRLEVSERTLRRALAAQQLSRRLTESLERLLQGQAAEPSPAQPAPEHENDDRLETLARRLDRLEQALPELSRQLVDGLAALRSEIESLRRSEPLSPLTGGSGDQRGADVPTLTDRPSPRRIHPELVEPDWAADDERVYGAAWPLVAEWRLQRARFQSDWPQFDGQQAEVRMLELELQLIGEHGLTLPPATLPGNQLQRAERLRQQSLRLREARRNLRQARVQRWLVRLLSLGRRGG